MRPNIVIINPDQMRADSLAHLGNSASITPNLDKLAAEDAISFRNAYCQNPVCVPSRCSFLTGLYPHVKGHRTMEYMLRSDETSLLKELKDAGYYVWMNPRNDFLASQEEGVFDRHATETFYCGDVPPAPGPVNPNIRGEPGDKHYYSFYQGELKRDENGRNYTSDDESIDKAIEKIHNRPSEQPFCLFLGLKLPHPPYQIEEPYFSAIEKKKLPARLEAPENYEGKPKILKIIAREQNLQDLTEDEWDDIRSCYLGMCMKVDDFVGKICEALKREGIYDDTAIFFFSDHGDYTGDYGIVEKTQNTFEDCLVNVPLLIKPPKSVKADPGITDSLAELVDFYATAMEMCGVKPSHSHFGKSLLPVIENRSEKNRDYVFSEGGRLATERHCDESNGRIPPKYYPYYPRRVAQSDDIAHTKATMIRSENYKYIKRLYEEDEFYDLKADHGETTNEINNPKYADIINIMKIEMLEWYQQSCDIVPFDWDKRYNYDMTWNSIKSICPTDLTQEVQQKIREEGNPFSVKQWIKSKTATRN